MTELAESDKTLLTGIVTAAISEYRMANPKPKIRNLLVIEEAHHLLSKPRVQDVYGTSAQEEAIRNLVNMMRTAGGTGVGIVLLDQLPTSLAEEAVKLPVNVIVHALNDEAEWVLVGKHARCTDSQLEHISGMQKGETIVFLQSKGVPINVQILKVDSSLGHPLPDEPVSDLKVKLQMAEVFQANPNLAEGNTLPLDIIQRLDEGFSDGALLTTAAPALEETNYSIKPITCSELTGTLIESSRFTEMCRKKLGFARRGNPFPLARTIKEVVVEFSKGGNSPFELAAHIHTYTMNALGVPLKSDLSKQILSAIQEDITA